MVKGIRCTVCQGKGPHYQLVEQETRLRADLCLGCLRNTVRFLSSPQDLARCLRACQGTLLESNVVRYSSLPMARGASTP